MVARALILPLLASGLLGSLTACSDTVEPAGGTKSGSANASTAANPAPADTTERYMEGGLRPEDLGPHASEVDRFLPDEEEREVTPALGGRIIMHLASKPPSLVLPIDNSANVNWILKELHDPLLRLNWETHVFEPVLATAIDREDTLVLKGGRKDGKENILFGHVREDGDEYVVTSGSDYNTIAETRVAKNDVESLELDTVFTFHLRDNVTWHDGHPFDARDAVFSWELYQNPNVDCDKVRYKYVEIVAAEALDTHVVRYYYGKQYFLALETFDDSFQMMPSHLYDLTDPDCVAYKPDASMEERGSYINDNPHNFDWVGLGPYKLVNWERGQYLDAEKYEGYYESDPAKTGYADKLRWRIISSDDAAFLALLNDEIDIFDRVKTEDYFGENTDQDLFKDKYYKAYNYYGSFGYTTWNLHRSKFSDKRVRQALAYAWDEAEWIKIKYYGLAVPCTGSEFLMGPNYNHNIEPIGYDPDKAEALLAEAGWYDRTGDGIVDKDGEEMVIEFLYPTGNAASSSFGQRLQESYNKIGVGVTMQPLEWPSFLERIYDREFDACNLAWVLNAPESDPYQLWYSEEAAFEKRSSNHAGYVNLEVDKLIDEIRRELDPALRQAKYHAMQEIIYEEQPYMFARWTPRKIAFNRKLRGVKLYNFAPGYKLRDMYYAYDPDNPELRPLSSD